MKSFEEFYAEREERIKKRIFKDFSDYDLEKCSWGLREDLGIHKVPFFDPDDIRVGFDSWNKSPEAEKIFKKFAERQCLIPNTDMMDYYEEVVVPDIISRQVAEYREKQAKAPVRVAKHSGKRKAERAKKATLVKS